MQPARLRFRLILSVRIAAAQAGHTGDLRFDALEGDAIKGEAQREGGIPDSQVLPAKSF